MLIVTHDWNGSAIAQLTAATKIAKHDVPAGYVNATQMCKACDKQFNDYARLESTKDYWEGLSADTGFPVSGLVITIKGGNEKQVQGTWVHPEIAMDLAQWVSVEFRIWANRTLKQVIQSQSESVDKRSQATIQLPQSLPPTPQEIAEIIDLTLGQVGLDPKLVAGVKLNAIAYQHPQHAITVEAAKSALSIPIESELVRPTALAEKLSETTGDRWTAIRVNKLLLDQGFQIKNPDGKNPAYLPTEKGKEYGQLVLDTAKGRDKTIQSLQWHLSVLEALEMNDH